MLINLSPLSPKVFYLRLAGMPIMAILNQQRDYLMVSPNYVLSERVTLSGVTPSIPTR